MSIPSLVGFKLPDGTFACVDCDIFPPGSEHVRTHNAGDARCAHCNAILALVEPVG